MQRIGALFSLWVLLAALGCSDDGETNVDKGGGTQDIGVADSAVGKDAAGAKSALQVVVKTLLLPKKANDYAIDLDGDGKEENKLGTLMAALGAAGGGLNPQTELDKQITDGSLLLLYDLLAASLTDAASVTLRFYLGKDSDTNAKDNFSGSEELLLHASSPKNLSLTGKIVKGALAAGPGTMAAPIPLGGATKTVTLKAAKLSAKVSSGGMASGQMNGAIPSKDLEDVIIPSLAVQLNTTWKASTDATIKAFLGTLDTDTNGTITAKDLKDNALTKLVLQPDVDTDGDKTADALSLGLGFTAVPCKIKK